MKGICVLSWKYCSMARDDSDWNEESIWSIFEAVVYFLYLLSDLLSISGISWVRHTMRRNVGPHSTVLYIPLCLNRWPFLVVSRLAQPFCVCVVGIVPSTVSLSVAMPPPSTPDN